MTERKEEQTPGPSLSPLRLWDVAVCGISVPSSCTALCEVRSLLPLSDRSVEVEGDGVDICEALYVRAFSPDTVCVCVCVAWSLSFWDWLRISYIVQAVHNHSRTPLLPGAGILSLNHHTQLLASVTFRMPLFYPSLPGNYSFLIFPDLW